jgi:bacillithiol system protein YtxJ
MQKMKGLFGALFSNVEEIGPGIPELDTPEEFDRVLGLDPVVIFKHSPTCVTSLAAQREIMRFQNERPEVPVYLISVRRRRNVAQYAAERLRVEHESPQVLVLGGGKLLASASHDEVTSHFLSQCLRG